MAEVGNGSILSYIKLYRENNISFFPLFPRTKTPVVKHAEYYNRLPSEQEVKHWLNTYLNPEFWHRIWKGEYPELRSRWLEALRNSQADLDEYNGEVNIAVAGGFGNLVLIDVEDASQVADNPSQFFSDKGAVVKTGKEHGYHIWVKSDWSKNEAGDNGEIRVNNQYVAAPPSVHPNGVQYEFISFEPKEVSQSFIETDVLGWIGAKGKGEPKERGRERKRERVTTSLWHELKEAAKELEVSEGKRSDWVFALTLTAKSLLKDEETAFEELIQIPIVCSKVTRDGKWDKGMAYEWWKKYEWDAVGSDATKTSPLYALSWAEKTTGMEYPADYEQLVRDYLSVTREKGYGHMLADYEIANELIDVLNACVHETKHGGLKLVSDYIHVIARGIDNLFHLVATEELDEVMIFDRGIYKPCEAFIKRMLQNAWDYSKAREATSLTNQKVNEIIYALRRKNYISLSKFYEKKDYINLKNGLLNTNTWELEPHRPNVYFLTQLNAEWDPEAYAEEWDSFLTKVVSEKDVLVLQEFTGYCLLQDCRFEKALALVGPGGSGKSTFLNVVREVLGYDNTTGFSIHQLENERFTRSELVGKLANIYNDLPYSKLEKSDIFKQLVSADPIQVERKYKQPFMTTLYTKLIFAANQLPSTIDITSAFFRRWIIVPFPNEVENPDPMLKKKLTENPQVRNYIFKWMVEGLKRLLEDGFSYTSDPEEVAEHYMAVSDSVRMFANEHIVKEEGAEVQHSELYNKYVEFCKRNNYPPVSTQQLSMRLRYILKGVYTKKKKNYRYWIGIKHVEGKEEAEETGTGTGFERKPVDYDETAEVPDEKPCDVCGVERGTVVKVTYDDGTITYEHPECLESNYPREAKEVGDRKLRERQGRGNQSQRDNNNLSEYELEDLDEEGAEDDRFW